jgi:hypothetical protein
MICRTCALILTLWAVSAVSSEAAPKPPSAPAWQPPNALLSQLDVPVTVAVYQLRSPRGYTLQRQQGPNGMQSVNWVGSPRANGVRPYLMLGLLNVPAGEAKKYSAEQILDKFLQGIQRRRGNDWKRTRAEHGTINGLRSGTSPQGGVKMHGFNYVSLLGDRVIHLSSQDVEPDHQKALALAEAAVLTFNMASPRRP